MKRLLFAIKIWLIICPMMIISVSTLDINNIGYEMNKGFYRQVLYNIYYWNPVISTGVLILSIILIIFIYLKEKEIKYKYKPLVYIVIISLNFIAVLALLKIILTAILIGV